MKRNAIIIFFREDDVWPPSDDFLAWREASECKLLECSGEPKFSKIWRDLGKQRKRV